MKNTDALSEVASSIEGLIEAAREADELRPLLQEALARAERAERKIKDLREKNAALEKRANILSSEDEHALYDMNATVVFKRALSGKKSCLVRSGGKTIVRQHEGKHNPRLGLLKAAVTEARKRRGPGHE